MAYRRISAIDEFVKKDEMKNIICHFEQKGQFCSLLSEY